MTNRNERRLGKKDFGNGVFNHPAMKRMNRNMKRAGRDALEVYRVDGETPEQHVYFDVFSMRDWAQAHSTVEAMDMDWERAKHLVTTSAVDRHHIAKHTVETKLRPIIVGRGAAREGNDQILDGAHTYVAIALAAVASGRAGQPVPVPAYLLQPDQWRRFVIPNHVAKVLDFDATFDRDDRTWSTPAGDWDAHFDDKGGRPGNELGAGR